MATEAQFFNRELSWIEFNRRVLDEAMSRKHPLLERMKFAAIVSSNFDEFFMVRVASLQDQVTAGYSKSDGSGLSPQEQLQAVYENAHQTVDDLYRCFFSTLLPALEKAGVIFRSRHQLSETEKAFLDNYFQEKVYPVLTPLVVDASRPFPLIFNKSLNIALLLANDEEEAEPVFATVQVPAVLGRFVTLPDNNSKRSFILLEELIRLFLDSLFRGHQVLASGCYRVTRNADLELDEDEAEDLLSSIKESLKKRKWGEVIRLEIEKNMDHRLVEILQENLEVLPAGIFALENPLDLTFLMKIYGLPGLERHRFKALKPQLPKIFREENDIFQAISQGDILIHHPYESFNPVVELVRQAANDPGVLAIKQTLYRVSGQSPLVNALVEAAENGKQVTVLVELQARFDEQNNILWAKRLEKAGCQVIYGIHGLKTHGKMLLVVRMEDEGIKRYVHLGTGNYNDVTASLYEDLGFFSANPLVGADASALFNLISGYSQLADMHKFYVAPFNLRQRTVSLIRQEAENARQGRPAKIIAKMNSLVDTEIITELYAASRAGVEIQLIVRGICCLRPGLPGISETITVRSLVGRFLEHSRIFFYQNDGKELIFLSSADWMPRNLDRRLEILFPIEDLHLKKELGSILQATWQDNVNARVLNPDGSYSRMERRGRESFDTQSYFYRRAVQTAKEKTEADPFAKSLAVYSHHHEENPD